VDHSDLVVSAAEFRRVVLRERARSDRNSSSLSLVLLDAGGDRRLEDALDSWALTIARRVRCTDAVGWHDARTIGIVLTDTDHEGALMVVRHLRAALPQEATRAHWRVLVHPEHTNSGNKSGGSSGGSSGGASASRPRGGSGDGSDPLDLLRAPSRGPAARRESGRREGGDHSPRGSDSGARPNGAVATRRAVSTRSQTLAQRSSVAASLESQLESQLEAQRNGTASDLSDVECGALQNILLVQSSPLKRAIDVVGAASALVVLSPVMLGAALAVKLTSPGPVFFRQQRAGLGGRPFSFYKFRSMCVDAEARKQALLAKNEQTGPVFKIAADPRITPVGRFLRRTSIDELPQLWNVLTGDMSLVGPRPPIVAEVANYERWQRRRLEIKGGLTCIWQVSGRSSILFNDWVRLDLRYVEQASLGADVSLLARTIPAVLTCRGAH
jgi:lipopolysaccharide/colanic/teichoic acid biosynthesis glycosyltransferase